MGAFLPPRPPVFVRAQLHKIEHLQPGFERSLTLQAIFRAALLRHASVANFCRPITRSPHPSAQ
jgi:hypothetical protein